jgi:hypothetical protein
MPNVIFSSVAEFMKNSGFDINNFSDINFDKLSSIASLTGIGTDHYIPSTTNPIGLNHYSFLEYCDIDPALSQKITQEIEFENLLLSCVTEEMSSHYLIDHYHREKSLDRRLSLLEIATDEHKHTAIYLNILKLFYPHKDVESILKNGHQQIDDNIDKPNMNTSSMFGHFLGEAIISASLKWEYKMTTNLMYKDLVKVILHDETKHMSKSHMFNSSQETISNKEKFLKIALLNSRIIITNTMSQPEYYLYATYLRKHNINFKELLPDIKKSQRAKNNVVTSVKNIFNIVTSLELVNHKDFEKYLVDANLYREYNEYI